MTRKGSREELRRPFIMGESHVAAASASPGRRPNPTPHFTGEGDTAMYRSRGRGQCGYTVFDPPCTNGRSGDWSWRTTQEGHRAGRSSSSTTSPSFVSNNDEGGVEDRGAHRPIGRGLLDPIEVRISRGRAVWWCRWNWCWSRPAVGRWAGGFPVARRSSANEPLRQAALSSRQPKPSKGCLGETGMESALARYHGDGLREYT